MAGAGEMLHVKHPNHDARRMAISINNRMAISINSRMAISINSRMVRREVEEEEEDGKGMKEAETTTTQPLAMEELVGRRKFYVIE